MQIFRRTEAEVTIPLDGTHTVSTVVARQCGDLGGQKEIRKKTGDKNTLCPQECLRALCQCARKFLLEGPAMKIRCEYCQNMVEVQPGADRICPYCGSPLPAAPEPPRQTASPQKSGRPALLILPLLAVIALFFGLTRLLPVLLRGGDTTQIRTDISVSEALAAVRDGTADGSVYQVVIAYYLEAGNMDNAWSAAWELAQREDGGAYISWCVEQFSTFERPDRAARLAMAADALSGDRTQYEKVSETTLDQLLPDSPLCQAMELALGRTAGNITLADLQTVTGLSVGRRDSLTGAQEIGVAFDGAGVEFTTVTVDHTGTGSGLGTVLFQCLRRLTISDSNIRTREDLFLPDLRELYITLRMDAADLTKFAHLKKLECLQIGGSSLTSLEGLDELSALRELILFDTGLTDLSVLAAQRQLVRLSLLDNGQLTSVASLSQAAHLESLTLSGKALTDLSPLASLSGLEKLSVTGTSIRDAAFLSGMTGLKSLELTGNKELGTVPELAGLTRLERLTLDSDESFASQDDLAGLASLKALKLRLSRKLSFLQPLQEQLEELTIYSYQASWDISGVARFRNLRRLSFRSGNDFYDSYTVELLGVDALRDLPLEELDLSGRKIYGPIDAVLEIGTLQVLNLNGAQSEGTDYGKFANLPRLQELDLGGYRDMANTPPGPDEQYWSYKAQPASVFVDHLGVLSGLERLSLAGCGVEDISALASLSGLNWLDLSGNSITDLSPLKDLSGLRYLNLSGSRIADWSPVEGRDGLTLIR